jgi:hypothetical protein
MNDWIYRIHCIISVLDKPAANALWTIIGPEGNPEANTFEAVELSASGNEPATHFGMSSASTPAMRGLIEAMLPTTLANIIYYACDADTFNLALQHNGNLRIGQPAPWEDALRDQGLQLIERDLI